MPTVVDSLIVTLGLDAGGFTRGRKKTEEDLKGTREQAEKTAKEMEARGKQAAQFFSKIRNEVLALTGAFLSFQAIKHFTEDITDSDAAVGRLAKNLGISTETLSAWEGAAKRFGSTSGDMDSAFRNLVKISEELRNTGTSEALQPLARAGINIGAFTAKTATAEDRMRMLSDAFSKLTPQDAQYWGKLAGFSESTINMLASGTKAIDDMVARQRRLNVVTDQDAKNAIARQRAWADLLDTFTSMGRVLINDISPIVTRLLAQFSAWVLKNREWIETGIVTALKDFSHWLNSVDWSKIGTGFSEFAKDAGALVSSLGGIVEVLKYIAAWKLAGVQGVAALAGWQIGSAIGGRASDAITANTTTVNSKGQTLSDSIGEAIAKLRAHYGDKEAQQSLRTNGMSEAEIQRMTAFSGSYAPPAGSQSSVVINGMTINTQATDAPGIAKNINSALTKELSTTTQSNPATR